MKNSSQHLIAGPLLQRYRKKKRINFVGTFPLLCDLYVCAAFKLNKTSMVPSTEHGN